VKTITLDNEVNGHPRMLTAEGST